MLKATAGSNGDGAAVFVHDGVASSQLDPTLGLANVMDAKLIEVLENASSFHASESFFVRALYDYEASHPSALSFQQGDIVEVISTLDSGWWDGLLREQRGWFPSNFVVRVTDDEAERTLSGGTQADSSPEIDANTKTEEKLTEYWLPLTNKRGQVYFKCSRTGRESWQIPVEGLDAVGATDALDLAGLRSIESPKLVGASPRASEPEIRNSEWLASPPLKSSSSPGSSFTDRHEKRNSFASSSASGHPGSSGASSPKRSSRLIESFVWDSDHESPKGKGEESEYHGGGEELQHESLSLEHAQAHIRNRINDLQLAVRHNEAHLYMPLTARLTEAVRSLLCMTNVMDHQMYPGDASAPHSDRQTQDLGEIDADLPSAYKRVISSLSMLTLAARSAVSVWPPADSNAKLGRDARDLSRAVQNYISQALEAGIVEVVYEDQAWSERTQFKVKRSKATIVPKTSNNTTSAVVASLAPAKKLSVIDEISKELNSRAAIAKDSICDLEQYLNRTQRALNHRLFNRDRAASSQHAPADPKALLSYLQLVSNEVNSVLQLAARLDQLSTADIGADSAIHERRLKGQFEHAYQDLVDEAGTLLISLQSTCAVQRETDRTSAHVEAYESSLEVVRHLRNSLEALNSACSNLESGGTVSATRHSLEIPKLAQAHIIHPKNFLSVSATPSPATPDSLQSTNVAEIMRKASTTAALAKAAMGDASSDPDDGSMNTPRRSSKLKKFFGDEAPLNFETIGSEVPWYLLPRHDSTQEIAFTMEGNIKGGTLEALIERLTMHDNFDSAFNGTFLLTYRSFTTSTILLDMLIDRYNISPPDGLLAEQLADWTEKKQRPIRLRVYNVMKSWLENYFIDEEDPTILEKLRDFSKGTLADTMAAPAKQLSRLVVRRMTSGETSFRKVVATTMTPVSAPILPKNLRKFRLPDVDPLEMARQLTLLESRLYRQIRQTECLNKAWSKDDAILAPNIKAMIESSNELTGWVSESIVSQLDVRKRANQIKHWITIAERCRTLNNFSTLTAIISALNSAPIHRLKRTWELINSKTISSLDSLNQMMASHRNFGEYRALLHIVNPPCVPFLGVYLTDLTFIEDGNPDVLKRTVNSSTEGLPPLININKRTKTAEVIREIQQYQNVPYSLTKSPEIRLFIQRSLKESKAASDHYDTSLVIEPREREDEKLNRLLSESGFL